MESDRTRARRRRALRAGGVVLPVLVAAALALLILRPQDWRLSDVGQEMDGGEGGIALGPGTTAGQTFVAHHAGLAGVAMWLEPANTCPLTLTLHLQSEAGADDDIAVADVTIPSGAAAGWYRFEFAPQPDSHGRYYSAKLAAAEAGVSVPTAPGAGYLDGAAHQDGKPIDAQTSFRLLYAPAHVALGFLRQSSGWLGLLLLGGFLFVVPGWALTEALSLRGSAPWVDGLALGAGLGLAIYPLLFLWADVVGLDPGAWLAWLPGAVGLATLAWRHRRWRPQPTRRSQVRWRPSPALWPSLTLLIGLALVFLVRLLVVGTLDAPLWGDSYEHATMTQLLLDHRGLPVSWEPYAPYQTFSVHFGFPAAAAVLSWATGLSSAQAVLWMGQLVNGFAVLALYPLAVRLGRGNRWAGTAAVIVAGLLSPTPGYYVNWGRFAQLAGQAILPVALWLLCEALTGKQRRLESVALAGVCAAGMALCYYRMPFYYAAFVPAWLVGAGLPLWGRSARQWLAGAARLALVAAVAVACLAPLGARLAGTTLAGGLQAGVSSQPALSRVLAEYQIWRTISLYVPFWLLVVSGASLSWALLRRQWQMASIGLWAVLMAALVAGRLVRLPGANLLQSFATMIALYIPVSLLVGWLAGEAAQTAGRRAPTWSLAALTAAAIAGFVSQAGIVRPANMLVTRPDSRAMAWIEENTSQDSLFLVETFRTAEGTSVVGGDAGWWIPLLARRETLLPPQYALMSETPTVKGHSQALIDWVAALAAAGPDSAEGTALLCEAGVTHLYIGQRQGQVGSRAQPLFAAGDLARSAAYLPLYHEDRVWVFALDRQLCGEDS